MASIEATHSLRLQVITRVTTALSRRAVPRRDWNVSLCRTSPNVSGLVAKPAANPLPRRLHSTTSKCYSSSSHTQAAQKLNQKGQDAQESAFEDAIGQEKEKQKRTPWHREGPQTPPVRRQRSAGAMTKGKLLTTPSRLLKLILPLVTTDKNSDRKDIEPLALLVHPQQPLSYLERLIQSELPTIKKEDGGEKLPQIHFRAEDTEQDEIRPKEKAEDLDEESRKSSDESGKASKPASSNARELRGGPGEGGVETYSGLGHEAEDQDSRRKRFVRWSSSTEVGDFIRDAARGKEFAVEIEGAPKPIYVGVPSFGDRTHYLRTRLRKTSRKLMDMASIKEECDTAAQKGGQRVAMAGFGILVSWWLIVYRLTFETSYGWDTMEPVTYLVGLSTLMGGYLWFLYHNREVSYRSALNLTISRRQSRLYKTKGFDLQRWEALVEEANALRKEIKAVANEYDVDWDEKIDEQDPRVTEALKEDREEKKEKNGKKKGEDQGDDE